MIPMRKLQGCRQDVFLSSNLAGLTRLRMRRHACSLLALTACISAIGAVPHAKASDHVIVQATLLVKRNENSAQLGPTHPSYPVCSWEPSQLGRNQKM